MVPGFTGLPKEAEPGSGKRRGCKSSSAKDFIGSYLDIHSVRQSKLELLNHHSFFSFSALNSCLDIFCLLICTKPSNRYARQIWVTYEYK